jgi:hypothetical protein
MESIVAGTQILKEEIKIIKVNAPPIITSKISNALGS